MEALKFENEQLAVWLKEAQESIIRLSKEKTFLNIQLSTAGKFIERQSGATRTQMLHFKHEKSPEKEFSILPDGRVFMHKHYKGF